MIFNKVQNSLMVYSHTSENIRKGAFPNQNPACRLDYGIHILASDWPTGAVIKFVPRTQI